MHEKPHLMCNTTRTLNDNDASNCISATAVVPIRHDYYTLHRKQKQRKHQENSHDGDLLNNTNEQNKKNGGDGGEEGEKNGEESVDWWCQYEKPQQRALLRPSLCQKIEYSLQIINDAINTYGIDKIGFSFNGGKDSTVLLHLLRYSLSKVFRTSLSKVFTFHFAIEDEFPDMNDFMAQTAKQFGMNVIVLREGFRSGLAYLKSKFGLEAVLLGTRRTDPDGQHIRHFEPTSADWPQMMRVSCILDWEYGDIWEFLTSFDIPYCILYDAGYTSLGGQKDTVPNPLLSHTANSRGTGENDDGSLVVEYLPAYCLDDPNAERDGRMRKKRSPLPHSGAKPPTPTTFLHGTYSERIGSVSDLLHQVSVDSCEECSNSTRDKPPL